MRCTTWFLSTIAVLAVLCAANTVYATPWVTPEGVTVIRFGGGTDTARYEYLTDGKRQKFPLSGRFDSYYFELGGRYGLLPKLEVGLKMQFKGVSYSSDPLLQPSVGSTPSNLQDYRESVFDFAGRDIGLADLYLNAGYQHLQGGVNISSSFVLKVPSGYTAPQETFANAEPTPEKLRDDVTLGDGKVALEYRLHAGSFINSTLTLFQASVGYEARFNGPGHRAVGSLKVGQGVDKNLFFIVGGNSAFTVFEGTTIGQSYVAIDPKVSALDFTSDNIAIVDATLDSDYIIGEVGVLARLGGRELTLSAHRAFWGKNFPELTGVSLSTIMVFD